MLFTMAQHALYLNLKLCESKAIYAHSQDTEFHADTKIFPVYYEHIATLHSV